VAGGVAGNRPPAVPARAVAAPHREQLRRSVADNRAFGPRHGLPRSRGGRHGVDGFVVKTLTLSALLCAVLFIAGFIAPRRSRRLQERIDHLLRRGEGKANRNAGKIGDAQAKSLNVVRRAGDKSASAGRSLREKAPR
jgi:hypothetical protein